MTPTQMQPLSSDMPARRQMSSEYLMLTDVYTNNLKEELSFYLDKLDWAYELLTKSIITDEQRRSLTPDNKSYLQRHTLLMQSLLATSHAVLRMHTSNISADSFALLRIMYEGMALISFAADAPEGRSRLISEFFNLDPDPQKQSRKEQLLATDALKSLTSAVEELKEIFRDLNNLGSHISFQKILDNNKQLAGRTVASSFVNNTYDRNYARALDLHLSILGGISAQHIRLVRQFVKVDEIHESETLLYIRDHKARTRQLIRERFESAQ